jgi:hypothetical protein
MAYKGETLRESLYRHEIIGEPNLYTNSDSRARYIEKRKKKMLQEAVGDLQEIMRKNASLNRWLSMPNLYELIEDCLRCAFTDSVEPDPELFNVWCGWQGYQKDAAPLRIEQIFSVWFHCVLYLERFYIFEFDYFLCHEVWKSRIIEERSETLRMEDKRREAFREDIQKEIDEANRIAAQKQIIEL